VPSESRRLRILFVAQAVSIHTARWISQINDQGWDLHLFDMLGSFPHAELGGVTEYSLLFPRKMPRPGAVPSYGNPFFMRRGWDPFPLSLLGFFTRRVFRDRVVRLAQLIRKLRPDIIHSFELQTQSYHLVEVAKLLGGELGAPWIVNTWGSDIFYFQHFPEHLEKIRILLGQCDYLIPDCARDEALARSYGFNGNVPLILPGAGGYPIKNMRRSVASGPPSNRRVVMVKGYQGWAGRAIDALEALRLCEDLLAGFEIVVYAASPATVQKVRELRASTGLRVQVLPRSPHAEIVKLFGISRLAIGINETDGVPNAMLEAMTMGAFPIQSDTQSTAEWIRNAENGLLVASNHPSDIAAAVRRALQDDGLVDRAAEINLTLVSERLDLAVVKPQVIRMYTGIRAGCVGAFS
jgi:glycosyltransferase involved in cell wall biosynthesis